MLPSTAGAHPAADLYVQWWHSGERTVTWHFDDDFPAGNGMRQRVKDGAADWNA